MLAPASCFAAFALFAACSQTTRSESAAAPSAVAVTIDAGMVPNAGTIDANGIVETRSMDAGASSGPESPDPAVDLNGDGVTDSFEVTDTDIRMGSVVLPHGLTPGSMRPVTITAMDIDSSDSRQELLLRVTEYESLGHHVVVFDRGKGLQTSRVIFARDLRSSGDGILRATNWVQGKRRDMAYRLTAKDLEQIRP